MEYLRIIFSRTGKVLLMSLISINLILFTIIPLFTNSHFYKLNSQISADHKAISTAEVFIPASTSVTMTTKSEIIENPLENETVVEMPDWEATEIELSIFKLFKGQETSVLDRQRILEIIDQINWAKYDHLTLETDFRCDELLYWLSTITLDRDRDIVAILNARDGLDGYMSDGYATVVSQIYLDNPKRMIRLMSTLDEYDIECIGSKILYGLSSYSLEEIDKLFADVEVLIEKDLNNNAEKRVIEILRDIVKKQQEDIIKSQ